MVYGHETGKTDPSPNAKPARDWDPAAALARVAGDDVAGFTERLHRIAESYARSPEAHLSFDERLAVVERNGARSGTMGTRHEPPPKDI
jgi:hypothetical protein